jgi:hypothetical protein
MTNIVPLGDTSPFDAIRKYRADGSEYCQEREMGFVLVQRFSRVLMQLVYATMQAKLIKRRDRNGCHVVGLKVLV